MFNAQYYSDKKTKLSNELIKKMESTLINIGNHLNEYTNEKNKFNEEMTEIQNIEKENADKPKVETKTEPKVEEKVEEKTEETK